MASIKAEEASRMEMDSQAAADAARVSTERRASMEEICIAAYLARLKQRGKPPRIRRYGLKRRGVRL